MRTRQGGDARTLGSDSRQETTVELRLIFSAAQVDVRAFVPDARQVALLWLPEPSVRDFDDPRAVASGFTWI
jgi:hypothetical protein